MARVGSENTQGPSLCCAFFGGPRDGLRTGDLPADLSREKLTGAAMQIPLAEPAHFGLFALYRCTSEKQVDGFCRWSHASQTCGIAAASASPQPRRSRQMKVGSEKARAG